MNRVLVVLPNWLGDTLFATPVLRAIRRAHPNAHLATLGWPQCREILLHNPDVNAMLEYDERGRHRSLAGKWRLIRELRGHRFDTAFILRKSLSRSLMLALAGIPERIGTANPKSGWLLTRRVPPLDEAGSPIHKAFSYLPLLETVGIAAPTPHFTYIVKREERDAARTLLRQHGVEGRSVILLHPGANWWHKRWAPERFAELGDRLIHERGATVVITGTPSDEELAQSITRRMRHRPVVLAGRTSLRELGACVAEAQLLISNDTGVVHMAAAIGTPLVALYGPTSPRLTGPLGDPSRMRILHHPDCCPRIPCYQPEHPAHPGMASIAVDEAYAAAVSLIASMGHR